MNRKHEKKTSFLCKQKHHHHARMQLQAEMIVSEVFFFALMLLRALW
jgi:hypothetical protein